MGEREELRTVGELLQQARNSRRLSVVEVSERTKISERLLEAIELDQFHEFSAPLYIRSFLRTYAECVGLDADDLLKRYRNQTEREGAASQGPPSGAVWEEEVQVHHVGVGLGVSARRWLVVAAAVVVVLVAVVWFSMRRGDDSGSQPVATVTATDTTATVEDEPIATNDEAAATTDDAPGEAESLALLTNDPAAAAPQSETPSPDTDRPAADSTDSEATAPPDEKPRPRSDEPLGNWDDPVAEELVGMLRADTIRSVLPVAPPEPVHFEPQEPATLEADTASDAAVLETAASAEQGDAGESEQVTAPAMAVESSESPLRPVPIVNPGLPPALPADDTLVFAGGIRHESVLRLLWTGPEDVTVAYKTFGQPFTSDITLPDRQAPPLPADSVQPGRTYAVREGFVIYWGTGRYGSFELRLSDDRGVQVCFNGQLLGVPRETLGRSWLIDAEDPPTVGACP